MLNFSGLTLSFSLYGVQEKYINGMHENLRLVPEVYPGASVVVYTDKPYDFTGAENIVVGPSKGVQGSFWRYYAYKHEGDGHVIFRDSDSLITHREAGLVSDWICSDKILHTIHDNKEHIQCSVSMMAGMTGFKNGSLPYDFNHLIRWWVRTKNPTQYRDEERFISRFVWPYLRRFGLLHSSVVNSKFGGVKMEPAEDSTQFIGSRVFK